MGTALAQVEMPDELRHNNDNNKQHEAKYGKARKKERILDYFRSGMPDANFAYGRRNAIYKLTIMRFGGPCLTDDAELLAEMLVPFIVEAAAFHKTPEGDLHCPEDQAFRFLRKTLPRWTENHGDRLRQLVSESVAKRAEAVACHDPARGRHPRWLPTMPELVAALRVTREEARQLRGWGCIDPASPEERREADRLRKRTERAAKGATPREQSKSVVKPWEAAGMSRATWYRRQRDVGRMPACETNASVPYGDVYGVDESVSPIVANDDVKLALAVA